jgi:hypothetical protein
MKPENPSTSNPRPDEYHGVPLGVECAWPLNIPEIDPDIRQQQSCGDRI